MPVRLPLFKQTLGWARPRIRAPEADDRWTWLSLAAYTQLSLARPLAADLRRSWEKPSVKWRGSTRQGALGSRPCVI